MFKIGDKVRVKKSVVSPYYKWDPQQKVKNEIGIISREVDENGDITVNFPSHCSWMAKVEELELAEESITKESTIKKIMKTLSIFEKLLLDKDTQTLKKAGFLNGDLELTEEGKKALDAIVLKANKAEFVASAEEAIKEALENEK